MSNVANKALIALLAAATLYGCSGDKSTESAAQALYTQATEALAGGKYETTLALLDSIDNAYPSEVAIRRQGMQLRPQAIEKLTMLQLSQADSIEVVTQSVIDSLSGTMEKISNYIEPYWVPREGRVADLTTRANGIEARMSLEGEFYIISALNNGPIGHSHITLTIDGESASTPVVPRDGELNYGDSKGEVVTYSSSQSQPLGQLAEAHPGSSGEVTFHGTKGSKRISLTDKQVAGIANAYRLSKLVGQLRLAQIEKQRLNQQLIVARNQMARLSGDSIPAAQ